MIRTRDLEENKRQKLKLFITTYFCIFLKILSYLNKTSILKKEKLNLDILIPLSKRHLDSFKVNIKFYRKYLNYTNLIILSQSDSYELIQKYNSVIFINEDTLVSKEEINKFLQTERSIITTRDYWYEQQFLKMAYSRICKNEYYLIWDADTIPIKSILFFKNNHPFFDMKTEHHIPYFQTMKRLLPDLKFSNKSYISEHQMIKTEYMKNLLDEIENNSELKGKLFWEKILMAINLRVSIIQGFQNMKLMAHLLIQDIQISMFIEIGFLLDMVLLFLIIPII